MKRRWNLSIWLGFLLFAAVAVAYPLVVERFPAVGDATWPTLLIFLASLMLIGRGLLRAFRRPAEYRGRIAGPIFMVLAVAGTGLFAFSLLYMTRQLPSSGQAPQVGEMAPDFRLADLDGNQVALADLLGGGGARPGHAALLIFYRGYW
ncbi:MAG: hypothetical protein ACREAA_10330 [Candidatus Polarisedimenticolia bacterium]